MATESRDFAALKFANRAEATAWLEERYEDQAFKFPRLRERVTCAQYVRRNLPGAMRMTVPTFDVEGLDHCLRCGHVREVGNLGLCGPCFVEHLKVVAGEVDA